LNPKHTDYQIFFYWGECDQVTELEITKSKSG